MDRVCVDASLVLALLLPERESEHAEALWQSWRTGNVLPVSPPLMFAEVPSVLRESVFFGRLRPEEGDQAFAIFCELGVLISEKPDLHVSAWELAREHNHRRVYDANYLATARAEGCELWSGDQRLVNGVRQPWVKWVGSYTG